MMSAFLRSARFTGESGFDDVVFALLGIVLFSTVALTLLAGFGNGQINQRIRQIQVDS